MIIGLVCEGASDVIVLQAVLDASFGTEYELLQICPSPRGMRGGKSEVQRWCEQHGPNLQVYLRSRQIDVLIVHVDADTGRTLGAATTDKTCKKVKDWLGPGERCPELVIVIPKEEIETWLLATFGSPAPHLEDQENPRGRLIALRELLADKPPWSLQKQRYEALAAQLGQKLTDLIPAVPELGRFARKLKRFCTPGPEAPPSPAAGESP